MRFSRISSKAVLLAGVGALASASVLQNGTYDYIVVGGGPSGIITAERFVEAGKKVLLLERGTGPTVATGSNHSLSWNNTITPIDLPGLSADVGNLDVWKEYQCTDTEGIAGCVLGGGVTLNYMVFVRPPAHDFDDNTNWPEGWKWKDIEPAAQRLYERNPGTVLPSSDGKRYDQNLYTVVSGFLSNLGWKSVNMLTQPNEKHKVYSYPSWNILNEIRAGPVRTYLPIAQKSKHFTLQLGTKVLRVIRSGAQVTGVEIQNDSGEVEVVTLAPNGRVVLAAGALSTPRILFNSGIGPQKQIRTAKKSGIAVPPQKDWINLPVGLGLKDHPIFPILAKTNSSFGIPDYEAIINGTDTTDVELYGKGSGLLTQGKHRLIFFSSANVNGHIQYYQGSCAPSADSVLDIKLYMTHGLTSSGVLGLDENQKTVIEKSPYLQTSDDRLAAHTYIHKFLNDIKAPGTGLTLETYQNTSASIAAISPGDHYASSAKLGLDDGRKNGTSVVDPNTKVYGTDNLVSWVNIFSFQIVSLMLFSSTLWMPVFTLTCLQVTCKLLSWLLLRQLLRGSLLNTSCVEKKKQRSKKLEELQATSSLDLPYSFCTYPPYKKNLNSPLVKV